MLSSHLLEAIFHTVEILPPHSIQNIISVLEAMSDTAMASNILATLALPSERQATQALLGAWLAANPIPKPEAIAHALQGASYMRTTMEGASKTELVWTGPKSHMAFRRTDQALLQVIESTTKDLWLITVAAYKQDQLRLAIEKALQRGVTVHFIAESTDESQGKVSHDGASVLNGMTGDLRIYLWPRERRETDSQGRFGTLHAKCALADQRMLLVSSANLTENALQLNMEMGLLVTGGQVPQQAGLHFQQLIQAGIIRLISP